MAQHGPSPATRHPTAAALRLLQAGPSPEFPRPGRGRGGLGGRREGGCSESGPGGAELVQHRHLVLYTQHGTQPLPPAPLLLRFTLLLYKRYKYTQGGPEIFSLSAAQLSEKNEE